MMKTMRARCTDPAPSISVAGWVAWGGSRGSPVVKVNIPDHYRNATSQQVRGPAYLHYKVVEATPAQYEARQYPSRRRPGETFWAHRDHFRGDGAAPTGMHTDLSSVKGFFIEQFESYAESTRFSGCLRPFAWSLPEEYRAPTGRGRSARPRPRARANDRGGKRAP